MEPATGSTSYRHGEKICTWLHALTLAPTASPASRITKGWPRDARCAAAASPIGPAPMMTTGNSGIRELFSRALIALTSSVDPICISSSDAA